MFLNRDRIIQEMSCLWVQILTKSYMKGFACHAIGRWDWLMGCNQTWLYFCPCFYFTYIFSFISKIIWKFRILHIHVYCQYFNIQYFIISLYYYHYYYFDRQLFYYKVYVRYKGEGRRCLRNWLYSVPDLIQDISLDHKRHHQRQPGEQPISI